MRMIALAGLALALSACGGSGSDTAANEAIANDMMTDENLMLDENASLNAATTMDANASVNDSTANLMAKDAVTNDPDTNLANGL